MEDLLKELPQLSSTVAIAFIGAILIYVIIKMMGDAHREKTQEFIAYNKDRDAFIEKLTEQYISSTDKLNKSIDANTQMTKETRDMLTQLIIQKK